VKVSPAFRRFPVLVNSFLRSSTSRFLPRLAGLAASVFLSTGCSLWRKEPAPTPPASPVVAAADYAVVFPDVIELNVAGRPQCPTRALVRPDGCIDLGEFGTVFAEGATAEEIAERIAGAVDVPRSAVKCQVAVARSRIVHLLGAGAGRPRTLPYAGSERVTDLLRRSGGISQDADPKDVSVIRRNVAIGLPEEVFKVDMVAIRRGDNRTDIVLEPNDEVHIGENPDGTTQVGFFPGQP
jgi:protein involved in polysaccharide export with SLBB domain